MWAFSTLQLNRKIESRDREWFNNKDIKSQRKGLNKQKDSVRDVALSTREISGGEDYTKQVKHKE